MNLSLPNSVRDIVAQEAKYHHLCLTSLYKKAHRAKESDLDDMNHDIAFREVVSYIKDEHMSSLVAPVFKLSDLVSLYTGKLEQLGA